MYLFCHNHLKICSTICRYLLFVVCHGTAHLCFCPKSTHLQIPCLLPKNTHLISFLFSFPILQLQSSCPYVVCFYLSSICKLTQIEQPIDRLTFRRTCTINSTTNDDKSIGPLSIKCIAMNCKHTQKKSKFSVTVKCIINN